VTRRILMKLNSSQASPGDPAVFCGGVVCGFGLLLATALFSTGCHKASDAMATPPPAPAPVASAPDTNQDAVSGTVANTQPQAAAPAQADGDGRPYVKPNGEPDLHVLDGALLDWRFSHQRKPTSFAEFAASSGIAIPPPPAGKKYALATSGHIILVDR
jgi:hypothetical protein